MYKHTGNIWTPDSLPLSPEGEQSAQCVSVAQLDTAAELNWGLNVRTEICAAVLSVTNDKMAENNCIYYNFP